MLGGTMLLGLDIGDVRVGAALAEPTTEIVTPHVTFLRKGGEAEAGIQALIAERGITTIVAGLPINEDGSEGEQCLKVRNFCRRLSRRTEVPIVFVDEYGSSVEADEIIAERRATQGRRQRNVGERDSIAAALILERFIAARKEATR